MPEYPEFSWSEGLANAMAHRDYSLRGEYTRVYIYDDRMEILSPGKLPNLVTLGNMRHTRYSRNPSIARVFTAFEWVRELNEGVNKVYEEMERPAFPSRSTPRRARFRCASRFATTSAGASPS